MKIALLSLSPEGAKLSQLISQTLSFADLYLHSDCAKKMSNGKDMHKTKNIIIFNSITSVTKKIFKKYKALIYVAPCGVAVRSVAKCLQNKLSDPAVLVIDVGGRFVVSLSGGHEGGGNNLALQISNIIGAEPVITTTTEAAKNIIIGVGCRRGAAFEKIVCAVETAVKEAGVTLKDVRFIASADIKKDEEGLILAASKLKIPLRFISSEEIRSTKKIFAHSKFVNNKVNLPAVAEPAALLAGRRTQLIVSKKVINGITVAVARENFLL